MARLTKSEVESRRADRDNRNPQLWRAVEIVVRQRLQEVEEMMDLLKRSDVLPKSAGFRSAVDTVASVVISMGLGRDYYDRHGPGWFDRECAEYRDDLTDNLVHLGAWVPKEKED